ncbi:hypothetical protein [Saliphagus infecundisoli]|uniref:Uncharacterized protein n=1 Tax=Saliphagus infecundisoli TaxID=1849069 RepID=A0ABD5QDC1_9EURY|nr:hypothetical protein [Saliphagus infecundisoli]
MRPRGIHPGTDRSPLETAAVASATVVAFFGLMVAVSYPLPAAAAVFGAVVALAVPRAVAAARARVAVDLPDADPSARTGSHGRRS